MWRHGFGRGTRWRQQLDCDIVMTVAAYADESFLSTRSSACEPHKKSRFKTFEGFGDSTLNFVVRAFVSSMSVRLETIHELHTTIHEAFNREGIEIAFPQRDVHIRNIEQTQPIKISNNAA